jgi:hypothetical protein
MDKVSGFDLSLFGVLFGGPEKEEWNKGISSSQIKS